jgi:radical SAM superfamily enzyme
VPAVVEVRNHIVPDVKALVRCCTYFEQMGIHYSILSQNNEICQQVAKIVQHKANKSKSSRQAFTYFYLS